MFTEQVQVVCYVSECDVVPLPRVAPMPYDEALRVYRRQLRDGTHDLVSTVTGRLVSWVL